MKAKTRVKKMFEEGMTKEKYELYQAYLETYWFLVTKTQYFEQGGGYRL